MIIKIVKIYKIIYKKKREGDKKDTTIWGMGSLLFSMNKMVLAGLALELLYWATIRVR